MKKLILALALLSSVSTAFAANEYRVLMDSVRELKYCGGTIEVRKEDLGKRNFSLRVVSPNCNVIDWGTNAGLVIIDRYKNRRGVANGSYQSDITYRRNDADAGNYAETFHAYTSVPKDEVKVIIRNTENTRYDYIWVKTYTLWQDDQVRR